MSVENSRWVFCLLFTVCARWICSTCSKVTLTCFQSNFFRISKHYRTTMYFSAQMFESKSVIKRSNLEGWLKRFKFKRYISFGYIYLQIRREKSHMSFRIQKMVKCLLVLPIAVLRSHMIFFSVNRQESLLFNVSCNVRYVLQRTISVHHYVMVMSFVLLLYLFTVNKTRERPLTFPEA